MKLLFEWVGKKKTRNWLIEWGGMYWTHYRYGNLWRLKRADDAQTFVRGRFLSSCANNHAQEGIYNYSYRNLMFISKVFTHKWEMNLTLVIWNNKKRLQITYFHVQSSNWTFPSHHRVELFSIKFHILSFTHLNKSHLFLYISFIYCTIKKNWCFDRKFICEYFSKIVFY